MHGQTNHPNKQGLKPLNGLPHGHQQRYAPILRLLHFFQDATNLAIEDRLKKRIAWQCLGNQTTLRRERTKQYKINN